MTRRRSEGEVQGMTAAEFLAAARARGALVRLHPDGRVVIDTSYGLFSAQEKRELRARRGELVELLIRRRGRPTPADHVVGLARLGVWVRRLRCYGCTAHPRGAVFYATDQRQIAAVWARLSPLDRWELGQHLRALGIRPPARPRVSATATKPKETSKEAT